MFMMFAPDLGEFAYCRGDAVVLSKEVLPVGPEGEAAALPISCAPAASGLQVFLTLHHD